MLFFVGLIFFDEASMTHVCLRLLHDYDYNEKMSFYESVLSCELFLLMIIKCFE